MKLYIDTSDGEKVVVGLDDERFETKSRREKSQRLLPFIDELLKKKRKSLSDITEIKINTGPGSYTGLRVGLAVALALGWSLGVRVNGKDISKGELVELTYE